MIDQNIEGQREDQELSFFNLATTVIATNNFSSNNKLRIGAMQNTILKNYIVNNHYSRIKNYLKQAWARCAHTCVW